MKQGSIDFPYPLHGSMERLRVTSGPFAGGDGSAMSGLHPHSSGRLSSDGEVTPAPLIDSSFIMCL